MPPILSVHELFSSPLIYSRHKALLLNYSRIPFLFHRIESIHNILRRHVNHYAKKPDKYSQITPQTRSMHDVNRIKHQINVLMGLLFLKQVKTEINVDFVNKFIIQYELYLFYTCMMYICSALTLDCLSQNSFSTSQNDSNLTYTHLSQSHSLKYDYHTKTPLPSLRELDLNETTRLAFTLYDRFAVDSPKFLSHISRSSDDLLGNDRGKTHTPTSHPNSSTQLRHSLIPPHTPLEMFQNYNPLHFYESTELSNLLNEIDLYHPTKINQVNYQKLLSDMNTSRDNQLDNDNDNDDSDFFDHVTDRETQNLHILSQTSSANDDSYEHTDMPFNFSPQFYNFPLYSEESNNTSAVTTPIIACPHIQITPVYASARANHHSAIINSTAHQTFQNDQEQFHQPQSSHYLPNQSLQSYTLTEQFSFIPDLPEPPQKQKPQLSEFWNYFHLSLLVSTAPTFLQNILLVLAETVLYDIATLYNGSLFDYLSAQSIFLRPHPQQETHFAKLNENSGKLHKKSNSTRENDEKSFRLFEQFSMISWLTTQPPIIPPMTSETTMAQVMTSTFSDAAPVLHVTDTFSLVRNIMKKSQNSPVNTNFNHKIRSKSEKNENITQNTQQIVSNFINSLEPALPKYHTLKKAIYDSNTIIQTKFSQKHGNDKIIAEVAHKFSPDMNKFYQVAYAAHNSQTMGRNNHLTMHMVHPYVGNNSYSQYSKTKKYTHNNIAPNAYTLSITQNAEFIRFFNNHYKNNLKLNFSYSAHWNNQFLSKSHPRRLLNKNFLGHISNSTPHVDGFAYFFNIPTIISWLSDNYGSLYENTNLSFFQRNTIATFLNNETNNTNTTADNDNDHDIASDHPQQKTKRNFTLQKRILFSLLYANSTAKTTHSHISDGFINTEHIDGELEYQSRRIIINNLPQNHSRSTFPLDLKTATCNAELAALVASAQDLERKNMICRKDTSIIGAFPPLPESYSAILRASMFKPPFIPQEVLWLRNKAFEQAPAKKDHTSTYVHSLPNVLSSLTSFYQNEFFIPEHFEHTEVREVLENIGSHPNNDPNTDKSDEYIDDSSYSDQFSDNSDIDEPSIASCNPPTSNQPKLSNLYPPHNLSFISLLSQPFIPPPPPHPLSTSYLSTYPAKNPFQLDATVYSPTPTHYSIQQSFPTIQPYQHAPSVLSHIIELNTKQKTLTTHNNEPTESPNIPFNPDQLTLHQCYHTHYTSANRQASHLEQPLLVNKDCYHRPAYATLNPFLITYRILMNIVEKHDFFVCFGKQVLYPCSKRRINQSFKNENISQNINAQDHYIDALFSTSNINIPTIIHSQPLLFGSIQELNTRTVIVPHLVSASDYRSSISIPLHNNYRYSLSTALPSVSITSFSRPHVNYRTNKCFYDDFHDFSLTSDNNILNDYNGNDDETMKSLYYPLITSTNVNRAAITPHLYHVLTHGAHSINESTFTSSIQSSKFSSSAPHLDVSNQTTFVPKPLTVRIYQLLLHLSLACPLFYPPSLQSMRMPCEDDPQKNIVKYSISHLFPQFTTPSPLNLTSLLTTIEPHIVNTARRACHQSYQRLFFLNSAFFDLHLVNRHSFSTLSQYLQKKCVACHMARSPQPDGNVGKRIEVFSSCISPLTHLPSQQLILNEKNNLKSQYCLPTQPDSGLKCGKSNIIDDTSPACSKKQSQSPVSQLPSALFDPPIQTFQLLLFPYLYPQVSVHLWYRCITEFIFSSINTSIQFILGKIAHYCKDVQQQQQQQCRESTESSPFTVIKSSKKQAKSIKKTTIKPIGSLKDQFTEYSWSDEISRLQAIITKKFVKSNKSFPALRGNNNAVSQSMYLYYDAFRENMKSLKIGVRKVDSQQFQSSSAHNVANENIGTLSLSQLIKPSLETCIFTHTFQTPQITAPDPTIIIDKASIIAKIPIFKALEDKIKRMRHDVDEKTALLRQHQQLSFRFCQHYDAHADNNSYDEDQPTVLYLNTTFLLDETPFNSSNSKEFSTPCASPAHTINPYPSPASSMMFPSQHDDLSSSQTSNCPVTLCESPTISPYSEIPVYQWDVLTQNSVYSSDRFISADHPSSLHNTIPLPPGYLSTEPYESHIEHSMNTYFPKSDKMDRHALFMMMNESFDDVVNSDVPSVFGECSDKNDNADGSVGCDQAEGYNDADKTRNKVKTTRDTFSFALPSTSTFSFNNNPNTLHKQLESTYTRTTDQFATSLQRLVSLQSTALSTAIASNITLPTLTTIDRPTAAQINTNTLEYHIEWNNTIMTLFQSLHSNNAATYCTSKLSAQNDLVKQYHALHMQLIDITAGVSPELPPEFPGRNYHSINYTHAPYTTANQSNVGTSPNIPNNSSNGANNLSTPQHILRTNPVPPLQMNNFRFCNTPSHHEQKVSWEQDDQQSSNYDFSSSQPCKVNNNNCQNLYNHNNSRFD